MSKKQARYQPYQLAELKNKERLNDQQSSIVFKNKSSISGKIQAFTKDAISFVDLFNKKRKIDLSSIEEIIVEEHI